MRSSRLPRLRASPTFAPFLRGSGGGNGAEQRGRQSFNAGALDGVKAQYLSTLIKLFEDKAAKGEMDEKLMERIERLMGG